MQPRENKWFCIYILFKTTILEGCHPAGPSYCGAPRSHVVTGPPIQSQGVGGLMTALVLPLDALALVAATSTLHVTDDSIGELGRRRAATEVARAVLPLRDRLEHCRLDHIRLVHHFQVAQHHDPREAERSRVGQVLALDVWRSAVHSLHEREAVGADVAGRSETEAADEAGTQVRDDVTVEVGHDQHIELARV